MSTNIEPWLEIRNFGSMFSCKGQLSSKIPAMITMRQQTVLVAACLVAVLLASSPSADANLLKKNNRPGKAEGQMGIYCGYMKTIALTPWIPIDYDAEEVQGCWGAPDEETQIPPAWDGDRPAVPIEGDGYNFCMSQAMKVNGFLPRAA